MMMKMVVVNLELNISAFINLHTMYIYNMVNKIIATDAHILFTISVAALAAAAVER